MSDHKARWYLAEQLVRDDYIQKWWKLLEENWTIRGWEIDLIMQSLDEIVFVEVKLVNHMDDLHNYMTYRKLRTFHKTIATYQHRVGIPKWYSMRVDVVFVKDTTILYVFDHCSLPSYE